MFLHPRALAGGQLVCSPFGRALSGGVAGAISARGGRGADGVGELGRIPNKHVR